MGLLISKAEHGHPKKKEPFSCLNPGSCSFGHYSKFMAIDEARNVYQLVSRELHLTAQHLFPSSCWWRTSPQHDAATTVLHFWDGLPIMMRGVRFVSVFVSSYSSCLHVWKVTIILVPFPQGQVLWTDHHISAEEEYPLVLLLTSWLLLWLIKLEIEAEFVMLNDLTPRDQRTGDKDNKRRGRDHRNAWQQKIRPLKWTGSFVS